MDTIKQTPSDPAGESREGKVKGFSDPAGGSREEKEVRLREEDIDKELRKVGLTMEALEARNEGRPGILFGMI